MTISDYIAYTVTLASLLFGCICLIRLRQWRKHLLGTRITVAYKNKVKLNSPLIDWFKWGQAASRDKHARGQVIYKLGATTIAVLQPVKGHGEATTRTVKTTHSKTTTEQVQ